LAEAENKADVIAGVDLTTEPDDVANILVDLAQRETKTFSMQFARTVVAELKTAARLHKHPLKSAGFKVLLAPDVPSVLVELGYMSTKDDLKQLTSASWRARTAQALAQAVDSFFTPRVATGGGRN
jgi:N-acetylmuramoyl-L-alanine amidase